MELLACLVPLYVVHRLVPFACATCVGLACYVAARRVVAGPPHTRLACALNRLLRVARPRCTNESYSPAQLCPVAAMYHNAEPHMLFLTPELHSEVTGVVDSILQSFILPWFSPLSASEGFPRHIEGILEDTLLELSHKLALIHPSRALQVCVETVFCHIQQLPRCQQSSESLGADHPATVDRESEWFYLQSLATVALRLVEPGDILTAKAAHLLVLHIICRDVLLPLVDLIAKPGLIYYIIVTMCTPAEIAKDETISTEKEVPADCSIRAEFPEVAEETSVNDVLNVMVPTNVKCRHSLSLPAANATGHSTSRPRASVDIERAVEADNFTDISTLHKVRITKTESRNEHGKGVYTVYCIEYQPQIEGPLYRAKRRFNEFINLQTCLSKLGRFNLSLRGVKGPSRWLE
ncbi:sorting nexin-19-like, partial [Tropilaelaps mercedesae]